MNTIGYAIFGTTKGLQVLSNGLFKELDIDSSLYINTTSHTDLTLGETVLLIRRIPTNKANLNKKDGVLIALYEYAEQMVGNRPGFMGSAICFKDKIPNADKLIQGLFFLFGKMKKYVDSEHKINSDYTNWDASILPNPNGNFGLFSNQMLRFTPLENKNQNIVVPITSLRNDSIGLLTHFCLNYSLHNVSHLYASSNKNVLNKLLKNGFEKISYLDVFNYNKSINILDRELSKRSAEISKLNTDVNARITQLNNLTNSINSNTPRLDALNRSIITTENKLKTLEQEYANKEKALKQQLTPLVQEKTRIKNELFEQENALKKLNIKIKGIVEDPKLIVYKKTVRDVINTYSSDWSFTINSKAYYDSLTNDIDRLNFFISEKKKEDIKKPRISLTKVLLFIGFLLLLVATNFFNYYYFNENTKDSKTENKTNQLTLQIEKLETENATLKIKAFKIGVDSLKTHQERTYNLLNKIVKDSIKPKDALYHFAIKRQWQYWELYYNDTLRIDLLEKVYKKSLKDIDSLTDSAIDLIFKEPIDSSKQKFSNKKNVLKFLERRSQNFYYVKIDNSNKIGIDDKSKIKSFSDGLKKYKKFKYHNFKKVDSKIVADQKLSEAYFKWLLKECNVLDDLKLEQLNNPENQKIIQVNLPWVR